MSDNLPAIVNRVGGELEKVVADIASYTSAEHPLDRKGQMALARMVEDRPELNTEARIAVLVDALSWHGLEQRAAFMTLVDEYDVETVYLALDYLYEEGVRDHDTDRDHKRDVRLGFNPKFPPMLFVTRVIEAIIELRDSGLELNTVERVSDCFYQRGGFNLEEAKFNNDLEFEVANDEGASGHDTDTDSEEAKAYFL